MIGLEELKQKLTSRQPSVIGVQSSYAVLVPLLNTEKGPQFLYEVRAETLRRQPGEICFPGGKLEPGEAPLAGALRETAEELGISPKDVNILGPLDYMHLQGLFVMHPYLGVISQETYDAIRQNPAEVKETFLVPAAALAGRPPFVYEYETIPQVGDDFPYEAVGAGEGYSFARGRVEVPIYEYEGRAIWGITGRITRCCLQLMGMCP
jgi:coenzyme A diphosphatase NUDT7